MTDPATARIVLIRRPDELRPGDVVVEPTNADERDAAARMLVAYVRREIPDPLPARPGYYVAPWPPGRFEPVVVELLNSPAGQWVGAGDRTYLDEQQVRDLGPLAPLARVDELLAQVSHIHLGCDDGLTNLRAGLTELARTYGVQT